MKIKFRYRVKLQNKKIYTRIIDISDLELGIYEELKDLRTKIISRSMFTGLKDRDNSEIYEDDIIKTNMKIGKVYYNNRWGSWWIMGQKGLGEFCDVKIIGNIYNNPELGKFA